MSYILANVQWFALLIGALIFFHELGHFLVAKAFDVKVVRFSLGFGPRIVRFTWGETEYVLSLLPLGGYVKMVGETTDEIAEADAPRALANKALWKRTLIVLAGPTANFLLAFVVYLTMFVGTHTFGDTRLGIVVPEEPAWQAGLRPGDKVLSVDGQKIDRWDQLREAIGSHPTSAVKLTYERDNAQVDTTLTTQARAEDDPFGQAQQRGKAGLSLQYLRPILALVDSDSPAGQAGLRTGDVVTEVNGKKVMAWHEVCRAVAHSPQGSAIELCYERDGRSQKVSLLPKGVPLGLEDTGTAAADRRGLDGYTGLVNKNVVVAQLDEDSPASRSGLKVGDRLLALVIDAPNTSSRRIAVGVWEIDLAAFGLSPNSSLHLEIQRGRERLTLPLSLADHTGTDELKNANHTYALGAQNDPNTLDSYTYDRFVYPAEAIAEAGRQVGEDMGLIGRGVAKMVRGDIPLANMGGPIMLFVIAEKSAKRGWTSFFRAMAMTSVNLGVLNVLPVPVLDGGHLLFFAIEAITRKPPSDRLRERATMVGMAMLLLLMVVVFRNDIVRFFF